MIYTTEFDSPVGKITLAAIAEKLIGLWLEGQDYFESTISEEMVKDDSLKLFTEVRNWLDAYFAKKNPAISDLPLFPSGSEFRKSVWRVLCTVPCGEVTTYGKVARKIAAERGIAKMSAQAIGGALAHNPISIIIPCHRVVGADGSLIGYAGGIDRKIKLLECEGVDLSKFFIPSKVLLREEKFHHVDAKKYAKYNKKHKNPGQHNEHN